MQQGNDVEAARVSQEIQFCLLHWGDDLQDTQQQESSASQSVTADVQVSCSGALSLRWPSRKSGKEESSAGR